MKDKIVVTGGAGFIGSHVVEELLEAGKMVYVIDNFSSGRMKNLEHINSKNLVIINADIVEEQTQQLVVEIAPKAILLLAAQPSVAVSQKNPILDAKSNILGLVNMLEAAKRSKCEKVAFAASGGTLYGNPDVHDLPLNETSQFSACSFYGLTKMTALHYLELYKEHFNVNFAALALGNVFGPRQCPHGESGVIAIFLEKMRNQLPCKINGDGLTTRDYIYVKDVSNAFCLAIEKGEGLLNISTGIERSVLGVFDHLSTVTDNKLKPEHKPELPGEVKRISLSNKKACEALCWAPKYSFENGIETTMGEEYGL